MVEGEGPDPGYLLTCPTCYLSPHHTPPTKAPLPVHACVCLPNSLPLSPRPVLASPPTPTATCPIYSSFWPARHTPPCNLPPSPASLTTCFLLQPILPPYDPPCSLPPSPCSPYLPPPTPTYLQGSQQQPQPGQGKMVAAASWARLGMEG